MCFFWSDLRDSLVFLGKYDAIRAFPPVLAVGFDRNQKIPPNPAPHPETGSLCTVAPPVAPPLVRARAQAMLAVDRAAFVRPGDLPFAYEDRPLPIGSSRPLPPHDPKYVRFGDPPSAVSCRLPSRKILTTFPPTIMIYLCLHPWRCFFWHPFVVFVSPTHTTEPVG